MYRQAQRGHPGNVAEHLASGDEIVELGLHVEADAVSIGVGCLVLSELGCLLRFLQAADGVCNGNQSLGG